jgi:hypothetical protein
MLLYSYFNLMERIREESGYARTNTLHPNWMCGNGGHRILTIDIPPNMRRIGVALKSLPREQEEAIVAKFGIYRVRGVMVQNREKARMIGIGLDTFRSRVRSAEKSLLAKLDKF